MKYFACLFVLSSTAFSFASGFEEKGTFCQSTKEYITVFRYLEAHKTFSLKKADMMKIADVASKGCNESAKRFISVNDLLLKAGLEASDALKIAMKFTNRTNQQTSSFETIFQETFLKEYLDLDIKDAVDFSLKLSTEIEGEPVMIRNDFQKIVRFCLDQKSLDLSGPKCSDLAAKVANIGAKFKTEISPTFLLNYEFLTDKSGPDLSTYKALEISLKLIEAGPLSALNFKDAYKFAISKTGLDMPKNEAISYSELMAKRSKLESGSK